MKTFTIFRLSAVILMLAACSKPPAIVGRWHEVGAAGVVAFQ
jgi:hypothetical protein